MVVGVGFEPTYATRADLQSAAFNHSATPPNYLKFYFVLFQKNFLLNYLIMVSLYTQALRNIKALFQCQ